MIKTDTVIRGLLTAAILSFGTAPALAKKAAKSPVSVKGFKETFHPKQKMFMNVCVEKICGRGSKVSYILSRPKPVQSFSQFKSDRKRIEVWYRKNGPKGATLKFGKPANYNIKGYTVFAAPLRTQFANGTTRNRTSYTVYGKHIWISLISSSVNKNFTKQNAAKFLAGLMAWTDRMKK